jgi:hypothetical protein
MLDLASWLASGARVPVALGTGDGPDLAAPAPAGPSISHLLRGRFSPRSCRAIFAPAHRLAALHQHWLAIQRQPGARNDHALLLSLGVLRGGNARGQAEAGASVGRLAPWAVLAQ